MPDIKEYTSIDPNVKFLGAATVHSFTSIDGDVVIGDNTTIWQSTNIAGKVSVGSNCVIGSQCSILGTKMPTIIGKHVRMQSHCFIPDGTVIGDNTFLAPGVTILNDKYPPSSSHKDWSPVTIENGARIGGGVVILPGVTIGKGALVGAGSVVTKDVIPNSVVKGSPARIWVIPSLE